MLALGVILIAVCYNYRLKKLDISDADNNRLFVVGAVAGLFTYLGASLFDRVHLSLILKVHYLKQ